MAEKLENTKGRSVKRKEKKELKGRMKNFLMFLPNMVRLLGSLITDNRVPVAEKALFAAAIVYAISPIDFLPDVFPFIGQVDDLYLIALTLIRLVSRTDEAIVREHWKGGGDIIALTSAIAGIAPRLLPQKVSRVLTNRVTLGSAGKIIDAVQKNREKILVAASSGEEKSAEKEMRPAPGTESSSAKNNP